MHFEILDRVCWAADDNSSQASTETGDDPNSGGRQEEKMFTESQVNKIVQTRLERERSKIDKEVESRIKELGLDNIDEAQALGNWRDERDLLLRQNSEQKESLEKAISDRDHRLNEELRFHESQKRQWQSKYESYRKKAELTQLALKAGADPENVDMIVTFTEGKVNLLDDGSIKVISEGGTALIDPETGQEMGVQKFMTNFLSERPGLVKAGRLRGAGTGALNAKVGGYTIDEIKQIAKADPKKYKELKEEGIVQSIYQKHLSQKG
ncbi:MAG: hypothetical protein DHS20C13_02680 [Thermodesulfobacteriota bacterium]|nr:MAG: hypothetical protein DHS20C13_02680 [Thermodesulfobacteriota bacterium]